MRSTASRGLPATASSSIAARCSAVATRAARLNGCSRAGTNRTCAPSASPAASATTSCPRCTGSNEPPNRPSTPAQDGAAAAPEAPGELLVEGQCRLAVRRVELGPPPQAQVRVARAQQRERRIFARRVLVGHLAEVVRRLHAVAGLKLALGEIILNLGHLRIGRRQLVREPPERHRGVTEVPAPELGAGAGQLRDRIGRRGRGGHPGRVMARGGRAREQPETTQGPHGLGGGGGGAGASALPSALIFCWARSVIVSPGVPPASACW